MKPTLRCKIDELPILAERCKHQNPGEDDELLALQPQVAQRGHLTKEDLRSVALWKSQRSAAYIKRNAPEYVQEVTGWALGSVTERARIEVLTLLDGVQWPTASVILHFFHPGDYPILDYRAIWSTALAVPKDYDFAFWWKYVENCRELARRSGLDMRSVDQALWQYSKENQVPA